MLHIQEKIIEIIIKYSNSFSFDFKLILNMSLSLDCLYYYTFLPNVITMVYDCA